MSFLLYGANGFTGALIVALAAKKGIAPVLAGRREANIKPLAEKYGLDYRVFGLENGAALRQHLTEFPLVLNCAGPFSRTAQPMIEACLATQTHYLDITGEIEVFERAKSYHAQALDRQIVVLPGVGFDVVPTDCMARYLHTQLSDATHLALAFTSLGSTISHGTLTTMLDNLGKPGAVRENGQLVTKPAGHRGQWVDFGPKTQFAMTIPWGDVSTAYHTTGIPNIETYIGSSKTAFYALKAQALFNPMLRSKLVKKWLQGYVDKNVVGPTESQLQRGKSLIWGRVTNAAGNAVESRLETVEGYKLTAEAALLITQKVLDLKNPMGYQTPAGLFGHALIRELDGTSWSV